MNPYRRHCWTVNWIEDLKLATFHILASENAIHVDKNHVWHMEAIKKMCHTNHPALLVIPCKVVDVTDPHNQKAGEKWWNEIIEKGGEGLVVKPFDRK